MRRSGADERRPFTSASPGAPANEDSSTRGIVLLENGKRLSAVHDYAFHEGPRHSGPAGLPGDLPEGVPTRKELDWCTFRLPTGIWLNLGETTVEHALTDGHEQVRIHIRDAANTPSGCEVIAYFAGPVHGVVALLE
jgi:hypothetical protein